MKRVSVTEVRDVQTNELIYVGKVEDVAKYMEMNVATVRTYRNGCLSSGDVYFMGTKAYEYDAWDLDFIARWKEMQRSFGIKPEVAAG